MAKNTTPKTKRPKRKNGEGCFTKSTDGRYICLLYTSDAADD